MNQKGFTLLEIIVAIGVFAVLTSLAYGGLNQVLSQSRATTEISEELQNLQYAFSFMQQDFGQIVPREIRDEYGNRQAALEIPVDESALIRFTRNGWSNPAEQPRSAFQRVAYQLEDTQLQRLFWFELDRAPTSEPINMAMLDNVEEIKFRFLDGANEWQEEWPPTQNLSGQPITLPVAIEASITTSRWGTLKRLFSLINVPQTLPAIGAPTGTNNNQNTGNNQGNNNSSNTGGNNNNNTNPGSENPS